jgi:hypothetical protein
MAAQLIAAGIKDVRVLAKTDAQTLVDIFAKTSVVKQTLDRCQKMIDAAQALVERLGSPP